MPFKYSTIISEKSACAVGVSLPISSKHSAEVCRAVRGKRLELAKKILEEAIAGKKAIRFGKRYHSIGHKKDGGAGRFVKKTCNAVLDIIKSAEANAQFKGLNTSMLVVKCANAHKCQRTRYGRKRRDGKATHIEIILEEQVEKERKVKE